MWTAIAMTIAAIISAVVVGVTNTKNAESVEATNEANIEQVKMTNTANAEQANLAYKRSLPAQQISDMVAAGISKPAAIQRITGGGTYSMPTMQAASVQPKHFDYSGIGDAMERLSSLPSSAQQYNLQREQLDNLRTEIQLKKDENRRAEEQHQFDMWQKHYGKDAALAIDDLTNRITQKAADKGINLDEIDTIDKLVNTFDLQNDKVWRDMPNMARSQVVESVHRQAEENRSRVSAQDTHDLDELQKQISKLDIKEKDKSLINKLILLQQQVELGKYTLDRENYEKALRDAGFENKKEAAAAIAAAENLEAYERKNRSRFRSARSDSGAAKIGYTLEWLIDRVNPLKGLLSN